MTSGGAPCPAAGVRLEADNRVEAAQMKMSERKPETTIVAESPKDVINS